MPVAIGFHPYFTLTDAPRDTWTIALGARTEWVLADDKIPTGETVPIERRFADPRAAPLRDHDLDHVFADLIRDASGTATMTRARSRAADRRRVWTELSCRGDLRAEGARLHLLRADGRDHRRVEPGAAWPVQGRPVHPAWRILEGDVLDSTQRVLTFAIAIALIATGRAADRATTIVGADLADGTGAPLRRANVRFVNDRIVAVGDVKPQAGDDVVDGRGLVVAPGFIDIHNHSVAGAGRRSGGRDAGLAGHHDGRRRARRRFAVADRRLPRASASTRRPRSTSRRSSATRPSGGR